MALNWDCSPAKSCYDVGRARYTMDSHGDSTKTRRDDDDYDAMEMAAKRGSARSSPNWFGRQHQHAAGDRSNSPAEGASAQDVCSYPPAAFGPPFAPPRYRRIVSTYIHTCLLYTSPSPRDRQKSRMPSSA